MMATRSMSRSGSGTTTTTTTTTPGTATAGKRKARSGQGTGSSTAKATIKPGAPRRPPVLGRRDANRQLKLTSVMNSTVPAAQARPNNARAGPSGSAPTVASSSGIRPDIPPVVIVLTSDDEDEDDDILRHPGLPKPTEVNAGSKRKERDNEEDSTRAKGNEAKGKEKEKEKGSDTPFVNFLKADNAELKQRYAKKSKEFDQKQEDLIKVMHENGLLQLRLKELETKVHERRKSNTSRAPPPPNLTEVDDLISCEICTMKMWHPATIRECGHTFCESCLHDWFNQTYTQHAAAHPQFIAGPYIPPELYGSRREPRVATAIKMLIAKWKTQVPQPRYTCPTCRSNVTNKPIEVYFVKEAVSKMAKLMKDGANGANEGRPPPRMNRAGGGIWDGFFPELLLP